MWWQRGALNAISFSFQKKDTYKAEIRTYSNLETKGATTSLLVPGIIGQYYRL
jgi:hypothetical protein